MKVLTKLAVVGLAVLMTNQSHGKNLNTSSPSASPGTIQRSIAGGIATGGGGTIGSGTVSTYLVRKYIEESKLPLKYLLYTEETLSKFGTGGTENLIKLYHKIFDGRVTIFNALESAQFEILENGPCLDNLGNDVEASAAKAPKICFNLQKISKNINSDSIEAEVAALVAHEVSHLIGTNEEEAHNLQLVIKYSFKKSTYDNLQREIENTKRDLSDLKTSLDQLFLNLKSNTTTETCTVLGLLMTTIQNFNSKSFPTINSLYLSFFSYSELEMLNGILMKSVNALGFCSSRPEFLKMRSNFKGQPQMKLQDYYFATYPQPSNLIPVPADWIIRKIEMNEIAPLVLELQDMNRELATLQVK
jgi:hypothetical protein